LHPLGQQAVLLQLDNARFYSIARELVIRPL
jgi:hypothetical protein